MKEAKEAKDGKETKEVSFTKAQLLGCKSLGVQKDVIMAVLEEERSYTKAEAAKLIRSYLQKEV